MNFTDQIGHNIKLQKTPTCIISLVPSQTELLYDLGLNEEVVGITKFCIHPRKWFKNKVRIGGTKNIDIEKVKSLNPDLIIANKEENTKEQIEELQQLFPVWTSDIFDLYDSLMMINDVGKLTNKQIKAQQIITSIHEGFQQLTPIQKKVTVLYLIWQKPFIGVGKLTFIDDMLNRCGFKNVLEPTNRYPELSLAEIKQLNPSYIFLSSEPFPFKEKHKISFQKLFPKTNIKLVDGEFFSWYGSRLLKTPKYYIDLKDKIS